MSDFEKPLPPPRQLTGILRYRALAAKPVSMVLLTCISIIIGCAYTAREPYAEWRRIQKLKKNSQKIIAIVTDVSKRLPGHQRGAPSEYVTFEFQLKPSAQPIIGERLRSLFMYLDKLPKRNSKIELFYDPKNPDNFYCPESDDRSLASRLGVQIVFLVLAGLLGIVAAFRYRALLSIICNAPAQIGTLAQVRTSAQGAFSRLVVVTFEFDNRSFVIKTTVPARLTVSLSIGDSVWILVPPAKPNRAVVAAVFL